MMKSSTKQQLKNAIKTATVLWGLVLWWYHFSEKIWYIHHDVQKELADNFGKKEILVDQETNDIIKLMSWVISQQEFDTMLKRHWYENHTIKINTLIPPDEAMYKTILEMQTKYGNPKISFSWKFINFETWTNEPKRARFDCLTNTIQSHQLDSVMIQFNNTKEIENFRLEHIPWLSGLNANTRQQYLINNWIAELAHARQLKEKWLIKMSADGTIEYIWSWFDYDKLYEKKGTTEYQAHIEYEPILAREFIHIYQKYINKHSAESQRKLARFNAWFFDTFSDEKQAYIHLKNLEVQWDWEVYFFLGKYYFDLYTTIFDVGYVHMQDDTIPKIIFGEKYTAKQFFDYTLSYYEKAYYKDNIDAWCELIELIANRRYWEYNDLFIKIGEDLLKNHIHEMSKEQIGNMYNKLWSLYYYLQDPKKWQEYYKLSDQYWWWYSYGY